MKLPHHSRHNPRKQKASADKNPKTSKESSKHVITNDIIEGILESIASHCPLISEPENDTSLRSLDDPRISDELGNDLNLN